MYLNKSPGTNLKCESCVSLTTTVAQYLTSKPTVLWFVSTARDGTTAVGKVRVEFRDNPNGLLGDQATQPSAGQKRYAVTTFPPGVGQATLLSESGKLGIFFPKGLALMIPANQVSAGVPVCVEVTYEELPTPSLS